MATSRIEINVKDESDEIIKEPDVSTAVSCIQSKNPRHAWRYNPNDPYIYVSFSLEQYIFSYGLDYIYSSRVEDLIIKYKFENVKRKREEEYKTLIINEWVKRAGLPIRFLPNDATIESIKNKNVCFIFNSENTGSTSLGKAITHTSEAARFKTIVMASNQNQALSNGDIYIFLHETGHAFLGMKHFKPMEVIDVAPFCELDCKDSVMAYFDDCKETKDAYKQLLEEQFAEISEERSLIKALEKAQALNDKLKGNTLDFDLLMRAIHSQSPPQLGTYDLHAAQAFMQDWKKLYENFIELEHKKLERERLELELKRLQETKVQSIMDTILDVVRTPYYWLNNQFDDFLKYMLGSTTKLVHECPGYFPPDDVTSIRNQHKFGNRANLCLASHHYASFFKPASNQCEAPQLAYTPTPPALSK